MMEKLEVSSSIVVESENDKYFIEALIRKLNLDVKVDNPICSIDNYECLGGYTNLTNKLKEIRFDKFTKLGIILDADDVGIQERIRFINDSLKTICSDVELTNINELNRSEELDIDIACYIMNIDGKGELETVLKTIKSEMSIHADCLYTWRVCLENEGCKISDKEFDKFWINNYLKFDTCKSSKHRGNKNKYCSNEEAIKKDIWNFEHPSLIDLKDFLTLFKI